MARARAVEDTLSMSFLDVLSCALGATVLLYLVLSASSRSASAIRGAATSLETPVLVEALGDSDLPVGGADGCWNQLSVGGTLIDGIRYYIGGTMAIDDFDSQLSAMRSGRALRFTVNGSLPQYLRTLNSRATHRGLPISLTPWLRMSLTPRKRNVEMVEEVGANAIDARDPQNATLVVYCLLSQYSANWLREPTLEPLVLHEEDVETRVLGRWVAPTFSIKRKHALRVCGLPDARPIAVSLISEDARHCARLSPVGEASQGCFTYEVKEDAWRLLGGEELCVPDELASFDSATPVHLPG